MPSPATNPEPTRAAHFYLAVSAICVLLLLVVIFVAQNDRRVPLHFLGWHGHLALGLALVLSAVVGGLILVLASAIRILQLRRRDLHGRRRNTRRASGGGTKDAVDLRS